LPEFPQILPEFQGILPDFLQIKTLGVQLNPLHPASYPSA